MQVKRWLHKILATIVVRLGMYVAEGVDYDILCEVTEKEIARAQVSQTCEPHTCGGLTSDRLKKIEDEWVERKIIG